MKIEKLERTTPLESVHFDGTLEMAKEIVQWLGDEHRIHGRAELAFFGHIPEEGGRIYEEFISVEFATKGKKLNVVKGCHIVIEDGVPSTHTDTAYQALLKAKKIRYAPVPLAKLVFKEYTERIEEGRATLGGEHVYFARLAEVTPDNLAYAYELTGENIRAGDYVNWWCDKFSRLSKNDFEGTFTCPTVSTIEQPDFNG